MAKNIILIIIFVVLFMLWFRYFEWRSTFFPTKEFSVSPKTFNLEYEDVFFNTDDGIQINAWFVPAKGAKFTILFSHGNGGNISHRISKIIIFNELGLNVFIFDYRGYGKSQGRASEPGIYLDTRAAYDYLIKEKGMRADNLIGFGESLGGAAIVDLAKGVQLRALILESLFSRAQDMAKEIYPFLPTFLIHSRFDSLSKIKGIRIPKLFIHSATDEIVPIELARKLYNQAPEPKQFIQIEGSHNLGFIDSQKQLKISISEFVSKL